MNQFSITVESPTSSEDICVGYVPSSITISHVYAVVVGIFCTIDPYHNTSRSGGGGATDILSAPAEILATGSDLTSFNDPTVPSGSWIMFKTTGVSACTQVTCTIKYTVD